MQWFRSNLRHSAWLALLALAINLALSFGHLHLEGARGEIATAGILLAAISDHARGSSGKHTGHPDDFCPICMASTALGAGLAAAAPAVPFLFAFAGLERILVLTQLAPQPPPLGFRSRGPPPFLTPPA